MNQFTVTDPATRSEYLRRALVDARSSMACPSWRDKNRGIALLADICVALLCGFKPEQDTTTDTPPPFSSLEEAIYDRLDPIINRARTRLLVDNFGPCGFVLLWAEALDQKDVLGSIRGIGPKTIAHLENTKIFAKDLSIQFSDDFDRVGVRPTYEQVKRDNEFEKYTTGSGPIIGAQITAANNLKGRKVMLEQELHRLQGLLRRDSETNIYKRQYDLRQRNKALLAKKYRCRDYPQGVKDCHEFWVNTQELQQNEQLIPTIKPRISEIFKMFKRINPEMSRTFAGFNRVDEYSDFDCVDDAFEVGVTDVDFRDNVSAAFTTTGDTIGDPDQEVDFDMSLIPEETPFYAGDKSVSKAFTWKPQYTRFLIWFNQIEEEGEHLLQIREAYKACPTNKSILEMGKKQAERMHAMWRDLWAQYHEVKAHVDGVKKDRDGNVLETFAEPVQIELVVRKQRRVARELDEWTKTRQELVHQFQVEPIRKDDNQHVRTRIAMYGVRVRRNMEEAEKQLAAITIPQAKKYAAMHEWMNSWQRAVLTVMLGEYLPELRDRNAYKFAPRRLAAWKELRGNRLDEEWKAQVKACTPSN